MLKRLLIGITVIFAGLAGGGGIAAAAPGPTPDQGLTGACNMTNTHASFGMFTVAGSVANPNGFDVGMIKAIDNTNGGTIPENCTGP